MDVHDERIFLRGVEIVRIEQPALHFVTIILPGDALGFAPGRGERLVAGRDRTHNGGISGDGDDLGRMREGLEDSTDGAAIV